MSFLFQVTLFNTGKDGIYEYAGPVGIVRYYLEDNDFNYETDYSLKPGAPMAKRITQLMERLKVRDADGLPVDRTVTQNTATLLTNTGAHDQVLAPVTSAPVATQEMGWKSGAEAVEPDVLAFSNELPRSTAGVLDRSDAPLAGSTAGQARGVRTVAMSEPEAMPATARVVRPVRNVEPVNDIPLTDEELVVERLRVTTIVRITESTGHRTEYRRVVDRHGAVVYFKDGVQVPEYVYRQNTGR
jgi:hypothetical protein